LATRASIRTWGTFGLIAAALHSPALAQDAAASQPPPVQAQQPPAPPEDSEREDPDAAPEDGEEIIVTGQRLRGAVDSDIPPEVQLDRRDIRALGAASLAELLTAIAPQTRSGRGRGDGGPVLLLNGRRISGFSEIRDIPPEAIERVDILPEEVALRYGYRADQRVVNFVLRPRFRAVTGEVEGGIATAGGRESYEVDANFLRLNRAGRFNIDLNYERSAALLESERGIIQADPDARADLGDFRTLLPQTDQLSVNGTLSRTIFGDVSATLNTRFDAGSNRSFLGLRELTGTDALRRETDTLAGHAGISLNGDIRPWRWSLTGNLDRASSDTGTDTNREAGGFRDRAQTISQSADAQFVASGRLTQLPAGPVSTTVRTGFATRSQDSETRRLGVVQSRDLSRTRGDVQASLDIPIASRRREVLPAMGDLSVNFNAEVEQFSDFGTLRTLGAGLSWSPIKALSLIASLTDEDGAPSMQQLGDPQLVTPGVRVFDFVRGETTAVTLLSGGNPELTADSRRVMKLGATLRPSLGGRTDVSLIADYTSNRIINPIAAFPAATAEIEAAFPDRFTRGADGRLLRVDTRPVNFARSDRQEMRWGINFSKPLGPVPPAGGFRGRFGGGQGGAAAAAPGAAGVPGQGTAAAPGQGQRVRQGQSGGGQAGVQGGGVFRGPGGGGRGFGGGGFGGRGGNLQVGLFHTWRFQDEVLIREGVEELDFLNGSAVGNRGGRPRHEVELQGGVVKNGLGMRINANWQSGTTVRGGGANGDQDLRFSDIGTVNLRLFADLGAQRSLVRSNPWLRGARVSLIVDNLFDSRVRVTDAAGDTPLSFQPGFLDPLGRSVRISFRKLFLPNRARRSVRN
jgi:hypothetical protein